MMADFIVGDEFSGEKKCETRLLSESVGGGPRTTRTGSISFSSSTFKFKIHRLAISFQKPRRREFPGMHVRPSPLNLFISLEVKYTIVLYSFQWVTAIIGIKFIHPLFRIYLLPLSRNRGHLGGFLLFFFSNRAQASKHSGTKTSSGFPPLADQ
jgi:hypothetical protein